MYNSYNFTDKASVERFDSDLVGCSFVFGAGLGGLSLADAWDNYYENDANCFYKILDLKLCLFNLIIFVRELEHSRERRDIADTFDFHKSWFGFVAAYRSFYDKFMNFVIEVGYKDQQKGFESARSKKKKFRTILESNNTVYIKQVGIFATFPPEFIKWMNEFISTIDDQYRTAEIHGAGMARKWVFSESDLSKTPYKNIGSFIDHLDQFFNIAGCIASGQKYANFLAVQQKKG